MTPTAPPSQHQLLPLHDDTPKSMQKLGGADLPVSMVSADEAAELEREVNDLYERLNEMGRENAHLQGVKEAYEGRLQQVELGVEEAERDYMKKLSDWKRRETQMQREIDDERRKRRAVEEMKVELAKRCEAAQLRADELSVRCEARLKQQGQTVADAVRESAEAERRRAEADAEVRRLMEAAEEQRMVAAAATDAQRDARVAAEDARREKQESDIEAVSLRKERDLKQLEIERLDKTLEHMREMSTKQSEHREQMLSQKDDIIDSLNRKIEEFAIQIDQEREKARAAEGDLNGNVDAQRAELQGLRNEMESQRQSQARTERELQEWKLKCLANEAAATSAKKAASVVENQMLLLQETTAERINLQAVQLHAAEEEKKELRDEIVELQEKIDANAVGQRGGRRDAGSIANRVAEQESDKLRTQYEKLKAELQDLKRENKELAAQARRGDSSMAKLRSESEGRKELMKEVKELQREMKSLNAEKSKLEKKVEKLEEKKAKASSGATSAGTAKRKKPASGSGSPAADEAGPSKPAAKRSRGQAAALTTIAEEENPAGGDNAVDHRAGSSQMKQQSKTATPSTSRVTRATPASTPAPATRRHGAKSPTSEETATRSTRKTSSATPSGQANATDSDVRRSGRNRKSTSFYE